MCIWPQQKIICTDDQLKGQNGKANESLNAMCCCCCCSAAKLCPSLCSPMDCSTPGLPAPHSLLVFAQVHVHWVGDAIQHLILCHPLLLPSIFPSIRVFSNELAIRIRWPKYWNFSISSSNDYSGLISCNMDWFDLLAVKGLSRTFSKTTVQKHQFFSSQLSSQANFHIHPWLLEIQ